MAKITNFTIDQGTTWSYGVAVKVDGVPIDQTWTATAQVRANSGAAGILHTFTTAIVEGGIIILSVTPAESSAWVWRDGIYDLEISKGLVTTRVSQGNVLVNGEVTR